MSSEYGGWDMVIVLLLVKNSQTSNEVWAGALSLSAKAIPKISEKCSWHEPINTPTSSETSLIVI